MTHKGEKIQCQNAEILFLQRNQILYEIYKNCRSRCIKRERGRGHTSQTFKKRGGSDAHIWYPQ